MKTEPHTWTIRELIDEHSKGQLKPNPEYQRGSVWKPHQKQMLVDSILRGYHIPVFYFHVREETGRRGKNTRFEIIDGQQRLSSITQFHEGEFSLLNPQARNSRFARHLRQQPCDWAGLSFDRLPSKLRDRFLDSQVSVAEIVDAGINEARELFVRLQQGSDLTAQERRDALPGEFGGEVARIAGRRGISHGHQFFEEIMRMKPRSDRGQTRQFVAQIMIALFEYSESVRFVDLNKASIDRHYHDYIDLGDQSSVVERFEELLEELWNSLRGWQGPKLRGHLVLHLFIMFHQLKGRYTNSWKSGLPDRVEEFMRELADANAKFRSGEVNDFHAGYGGRLRNNSDRSDTITSRHQFFMKWMRDRLDFQPLDSNRSFGAFDREYLYLKSNGVCAYAKSAEICGDDARMSFEASEVHHVLPHSKGGQTDLDNAALTHRECNRKIRDQYIPPPGWKGANQSSSAITAPFSVTIPNPNISAGE